MRRNRPWPVIESHASAFALSIERYHKSLNRTVIAGDLTIETFGVTDVLCLEQEGKIKTWIRIDKDKDKDKDFFVNKDVICFCCCILLYFLIPFLFSLLVLSFM